MELFINMFYNSIVRNKSVMKDPKEEKKLLILESARKIFAQYGFNKTTLDDIGSAVGMKKNSLYHYFTGKEEIFAELIKIEIEAFYKHVRSNLDENVSTADKLVSLAKISLHYDRERLNVYNASVMARLDILDTLEDYFMDFIKNHSTILEELLKEGVEKGEFIQHDYKELAGDIIEMTTSIKAREYQRQRMKNLDEINYTQLEKVITNLMTVIVRGLKVTEISTDKKL